MDKASMGSRSIRGYDSEVLVEIYNNQEASRSRGRGSMLTTRTRQITGSNLTASKYVSTVTIKPLSRFLHNFLHKAFSRPLAKSSTMLQGSHVFSPQHQYIPGELSWLHHPPHQQHTQQSATAAPASASQHGQYDRIDGTHNSTIPSLDADPGQDANMINNVTEEYSRTLASVADLLDKDTREAALLELSRKREQVPELALIL
jgi:hypothetical protein